MLKRLADFVRFLLHYPPILASIILLIGAGLHFSGAITCCPVFVRFLISTVICAILPGYAIFYLLAFKQKNTYDRLTVFMVSNSLSFSFNFIVNIFTYIFGFSLAQTVTMSLSASLIMYLVILIILFHRRKQEKDQYHPFSLGVCLMLGVVFLVGGIMYYRTMPGLYVEELVILRKIFMNHSIELNNLAFVAKENTTYMFVPFYLLISMVSQMCRIDVIQGVALFWVFTTIIATFCLVKISYLITRSHFPSLIIMLFVLISAFFVPQVRSDSITVFLPTPDRYGFSVGVLLFLAIFHFLVHIRDENTNAAMFIALLYLIIEVTFVHARAALTLLGMLFLSWFIFFADFKNNRRIFKKISITLILVTVAMLVYKAINLAFAPELHQYLQGCKRICLEQLSALCYQGKIFSHFFQEVKLFDTYSSNIFSRNLPAFGFFTLTMLFLPVYVFMVKSIHKLWLPACIAFYCLLMLSGVLKLLVSFAIGSMDLYRLNSVVFICAFLVFSDMVHLVVRSIMKGFQSVIAQVTLCVSIVLLAASVIQFFSNLNYLTGCRSGDVALFVIVLMLVILKLFRQKNRGVPLAEDFVWKKTSMLLFFRTNVRLVFLMSFFALLAFFPLNTAFSSPKFQLEPSAQLYTGDLYNDLNRLAEKNKLWSAITYKTIDFPHSIYEYVNTKLPQQKSWLSGSTGFLMMLCNQYAPIFTYEGRYPPGGFIRNEFFREEIGGTDQFSLVDLFSDWAKMEWVLKKYQIDYLLMNSKETAAFKKLLLTHPKISNSIRLIYVKDGFAVASICEGVV